MEEQANSGNQSAKKKKSGYHLMLFLDSKDGMIKQMWIGQGIVNTILVIALILIIVPFVGWKQTKDAVSDLQGKLNAATAQCEELVAQKSELEVANTELSNKVTVLSDTVNAKVVRETELEKEDDKAHMPNAFPLSASASMESATEANTNRLIFTADSGSILASGAGVISEITTDEKYAKKLTIDHGNGYVSVYYNNGTPMVREGDEVVPNSILFIIGEDNNKLEYEIFKNGVAIDPMSIINIDG